jgi:hypothetical protein
MNREKFVHLLEKRPVTILLGCQKQSIKQVVEIAMPRAALWGLLSGFSDFVCGG